MVFAHGTSCCVEPIIPGTCVQQVTLKAPTIAAREFALSYVHISNAKSTFVPTLLLTMHGLFGEYFIALTQQRHIVFTSVSKVHCTPP